MEELTCILLSIHNELAIVRAATSAVRERLKLLSAKAALLSSRCTSNWISLLSIFFSSSLNLAPAYEHIERGEKCYEEKM